jgi:hypothetical protein
MANIVDPLVVNWANTRARVLADKIMALSYALTAYQADYASAGMATAVITDGATNLIQDGSAVDGRTPVVGTDLQNLIAGVNQIVTQFATNIVGVGSPITTIAGKWQVNGTPR